jgi:hypothetical protein
MKVLVVSIWFTLVAVALTAGSCSINHRSDDFTTCNDQSDCPGNLVCNSGLCVTAGGMDAGRVDGGGGVDAAICPSQCTSCKLATKECRVDCAVSPATCNNPIVCPAGFKCEILCTVNNSCRNGINCMDAESCDIECKGQAACRNITCGEGPCDVNCSGLQSCRNVACGDSCACDVNCDSDLALCEGVVCGDFQCRTFSGGCSSTILDGCNTCP